MTHKIGTTVITMSACALLSACASSAAGTSSVISTLPSVSATSSPPPSGIEPVYLGPVSSIQRLDGGDVIVSPPDASETANASWRTAFQMCSDGTGVCTDSSIPSIALGDVTTEAAGSAGPNGTIIPLINNSLTYVVRWDKVPCPPSAGPADESSSSSPSDQPAKLCTLIDLVDANSGQYVYAFEGPFVG